jgi:3-deoxy-7-phosphoheptulonate synthase
MIIVFKAHTSAKQIDDVKKRIIDLGYQPRIIHGVERTVIGAVGDELSHRSLEALLTIPCIESVVPIQKRYKLVSRQFQARDSVVKVGAFFIGGGHFQVVAGPCAIESRKQLRQAMQDLTRAGVSIIRAGAYKPRTSPYDFQGLGEVGLRMLGELGQEFGVATVTEVVAVHDVEIVASLVDMLQVGARNCQNYNLLEIVAGAGKPVLLKRGPATTIEEWLSSAEYLMAHGCKGVVLCERGIRTFEHATRNTLDLSAVAVAKQESHLPVVVDPSHAAGIQSLVVPLSKAGIAVGADGLMIEAHPNPVSALSDAAQQLVSSEFGKVMAELRPYVALADKTMG